VKRHKDKTNALTQGAPGYRVDASSRLPKHALSCDRLGRARERYFGWDDAGNTHHMRRKSPFVPRRPPAGRGGRRQKMATVPVSPVSKMATVPVSRFRFRFPVSHAWDSGMRSGVWGPSRIPFAPPRKGKEEVCYA